MQNIYSCRNLLSYNATLCKLSLPLHFDACGATESLNQNKKYDKNKRRAWEQAAGGRRRYLVRVLCKIERLAK